MGCLCSCLQEQPTSHAPSSKTPLLSGPTSSPTSPPTQDTNGSSHSVRQIKVERKDLLTSVEVLASVQCGKLPLSSLDKTFQDHSKLYNDLLANFKTMKDCVHDFKSLFEYDTNGIPVLSECIALLGKRCGGAALTATRTKYSITIEYDRQEVSKRCQGPAEDTIEALELFNKINKLSKSILEKSPKVKNSVQVVLDDEQSLRREISKADLSGSEEPEVMKVCVSNINKLRKLPGSIETIQKHTHLQFNEIKEASKVLFEAP